MERHGFPEVVPKIYIDTGGEGVCVRTEELDWCVYRLLADGNATSVTDVIRCLGEDPGPIEASLKRLEDRDLIDRSGPDLRVLSVPESIARNQIRMDPTSPLVVEQGVIRVKRKEEKPI